MGRSSRIDFVGAFEKGWTFYKGNFKKLVIWGAFLASPLLFFAMNLTAGFITTFVLEGFFMVLLANAIVHAVSGTPTDILNPRVFTFFAKNGVLLSVIMLPLLTLASVILVVPAVLLFSAFMFSFFLIAEKRVSSVDSMMQSMQMTKGSRFPLFLFSAVFFFAIILCSVSLGLLPPLGFVLFSGVLPYLFCVIYQFYRDLENK